MRAGLVSLVQAAAAKHSTAVAKYALTGRDRAGRDLVMAGLLAIAESPWNE